MNWKAVCAAMLLAACTPVCAQQEITIGVIQYDWSLSLIHI